MPQHKAICKIYSENILSALVHCEAAQCKGNKSQFTFDKEARSQGLILLNPYWRQQSGGLFACLFSVWFQTRCCAFGNLAMLHSLQHTTCLWISWSFDIPCVKLCALQEQVTFHAAKKISTRHAALLQIFRGSLVVNGCCNPRHGHCHLSP